MTAIMKLTKHFGKFLSTIEPDAERVLAVAEAHKTLRDHLQQDAELTWPVDDSYLSGSYARDTAIDPVKDVDIILLLNDVEVDTACSELAPRPILCDLKQAIDDFYDKVNLEQQRRSIQVELPEDDIRMDVVPATLISAESDEIYVPDYEQKCWVKSNPKAHMERKTKLNAINGRFVPLVKMTKWWRGQQIAKTKRPKSFLLECVLADHYVGTADSVAEMFVATMRAIQTAYGPYRALKQVPPVTDPGISTNNLSESCSWSLESFLAFLEAVDEAIAIAEPALTMEEDAAIKQWRKLFGEAFPKTVKEPATSKSLTQSSAVSSAPARRHAFPYMVSLDARLSMSQGGDLQERYHSGGRKLAKGIWLRFQVLETDAPKPYTVRWVVTNHGKEARVARDPGHVAHGSRTRWEHTRYRGHHLMDCEIWKDGGMVARKRHVVNIR